MCGIFGVWGIGLAHETFQRGLDTLAHRGPDAEGIFATEVACRPILLGHRRLSIIDLSEAANQPFQKDGLVITFNGEIYNYRELRDELEMAGSRFRTNSDTEVIVEAFRRWGVDSFSRLRGMYAFAILDERSGALTLARDPFGIKPLFVCERGDGLAFASEPKALISIGLVKELNPSALLASLMFLWVPEDISAFQGLKKLPAGTWFSIGTNGTKQGRFWNHRDDLFDIRRQPVSTDELRLILEDSVAKHMIADVPVSTFLSGGLDSSLITVLAKRYSEHLDAYTINVRSKNDKIESMPEDAPYARKVAKLAGVTLREIEVNPSISEFLPRLVRMMDEPVGDPAAINVLMMCEAARTAGTKVLLSGVGADEVFGGYRRHQAQVIAQHYRRIPSAIRTAISGISRSLPVMAFGRGLVSVRWLKRFLSFSDMPAADAYLRSYTYWSRDELSELLPKFDGNAFDEITLRHRDVFETLPDIELVNRLCFTDLHYFLPGLNLTYTDRASMAASTEVRVPFVDIEVVRAACSLPDSEKVNSCATKIALKKAAEAYLPREIIYRSKASFGVPLRSWVLNELADAVDDIGGGGRLESLGVISRKTVNHVIEQFRSGKLDYSYQLWHLLVLESWLSSLDEQRIKSPQWESNRRIST